jgi:hypothetical protein
MNLNRYLGEVNQTPVLALTLVIAAGVAFSAGNLGNSGNSMDSGLEWSNQITIEKNGQQIDQFHNKLTDQGKNYIAGELFGTAPTDAKESFNYFDYISLGYTTDGGVQPGDDVLDNEYTDYNLSRRQASTKTFNNSDADTYTLKKKFKADLSPGPEEIDVNMTGLNYESTAGSDTLISGGNFTTATLTDGDKLTVTHEVTISGSSQ